MAYRVTVGHLSGNVKVPDEETETPNKHLPALLDTTRLGVPVEPLPKRSTYLLEKIDPTYPVMGTDPLKVGDTVCRAIREWEHAVITTITRDPVKNRITNVWIRFNNGSNDGRTLSYEPQELRRVRFIS